MSRVILSKIPPTALQFLIYLCVGGFCTLFDIIGFWVLVHMNMPIYPASATSFTLSAILNYFLSYMFVFQRGRFSRLHEFARVMLASLLGLALNTGLVWLGVTVLGMPALSAKILAVPIGLIWNFGARKFFVFHKDLPKFGAFTSGS